MLEIEYQYALWKKNYEKAYNSCFEIIKGLNAKELRGYRSYWMFLAACSAYYLYRSGRIEYEAKAREFFSKAADKEKYPSIGSKRIISLFITNANRIEDSARTEAKDLFYLSKDDFVNWCTKASNVLMESYNSFSSEGSFDWREAVHNKFVTEKITPKDFFDLASKTKLTDLP